jgi:hypothetical protein
MFAVIGLAPAALLAGSVLARGVSLAALFPALAAVLVVSAGDPQQPVAGHAQKRFLTGAGVVVILLGVELAETRLASPAYALLVGAVPAGLSAWILSGVYAPSPAVRRLVRALMIVRAPRRAYLVAALAWPLAAALSIVVCSRLGGMRVSLPPASSLRLLGGWVVTGVFTAALTALAWYGFAARRLLRRLSPVVAGLLIGALQWLVVWGPSLHAATLTDPFFASRLAASAAAAVAGIWVYGRSRSSLLPIWLMDALSVASRDLALLVVTPVVAGRGDVLDELFAAAAVTVALVLLVAGRMWRRAAAPEAVER